MNTYWFSLSRIFSTSSLCLGQYNPASIQSGQFRYLLKSINSRGFLRFVLIPVFFSFSMISNSLSRNSCYLRFTLASVWTCSHSNTHFTAWTIQKPLFEVVITISTVTATYFVYAGLWCMLMNNALIFTDWQVFPLKIFPPSLILLYIWFHIDSFTSCILS